MIEKTRLVIASGNEGNARELRAMLPTFFDVDTAGGLGVTIPEETGTTFEDNARLKAIGVSRDVDGLVLADDSGLVVDALDGRPGVYSARYAGEPANDATNVAKLLGDLVDVPAGDRAARFVCVLCLARRGVLLALVRGEAIGSIARVPRGVFGFGYDPVFITADGRTMAELEPAEKDRISHRGAALRRLIPILVDLPTRSSFGEVTS